MTFLALAGVTRPMLDNAGLRVLARETAPGFFSHLVAREFWMKFLEERFSQRFETINAPFYERLDALHSRRMELVDGDYIQQVGEIQRERALEVEAYAVRLTEDIAGKVARNENGGPSRST